MKTEDVLKELDNLGIRRVKVGGFDVDGVLRGKFISRSKLESTLEKGLGFCDVIFGWDSADVLYENVGVTYTGWHTGYPDAHARIETDTFRIVPWEPDTAFFLLDFYDGEGRPLAISPLQALKRVAARAEEMGYYPLMGAEYEYFFFEETMHSAHEKGFVGLQPLSPGMFGYSVLRASAFADFVTGIIESMEAYRCPIEGMHTETGPGVYETALQADHAVEAGIRAALFKTGVKELTAKANRLVTFMAKIDPALPGCSGHLHQSLWDRDKTSNLFASPDDSVGMSATFRSYLAGVLATLPELTALYAPTINSYKRLVEGMWAPTIANWGHDNRTCALRVITGPGAKATRVELRASGADANPLLALAGTLAGGLHGVENSLELPPMVEGNGYEDPEGRHRRLPATLEEAADLLDGSEVARKWLGDAFVDHYVATRRWEVREARKAVTDWELKRYFELV